MGKVILNASYGYFPSISGVGEIIRATYTKLLEQGHIDKVILLCADTEKTGVYYENQNGIEIYRFKMIQILNGRIPLPSYDMWRKLCWLIKEFKPYQIHTHTRFQFLNIFALIASRLFKTEIVHVEYLASHVKGESLPITLASYLWDKTISKFVFAKSHRIVSTSESITEFICGTLKAPKGKVVTIPNASTIAVYPVSYQQKFEGVTLFKIAYIGRFVKLKNLMTIIKAVHLLIDKKLPVQFNLAGDGALKNEILQYIELHNLHPYVNYLGKISKEDVRSLLVDNHIFLNPSNLEGLPNTVLEAISCSNFVVTTNVGGNKDLIKVDDCLIDLNILSPEVLAERIETLIKNSAYYVPLFESNKSYVINNFSWDNVVQLYCDHIIHSEVTISVD